MKRGIILLFSLILLVNIILIIAPEIPCNDYYWIDNTHKNCELKQFCGAYMYLGLETYNTYNECLNAVGNLNVSCTDSDGLSYYAKGEVDIKTLNNNQSYHDECVYKLEETNAQHYAKVGNVLYNNLVSCSGDNCYVAEAICSGNEQSWDVFNCPYGCSDGACLKESKCGDKICTEDEKRIICPSCPVGQVCTQGCKMVCPEDCETNTCYDSDFGVDIFTKGYVKDASGVHWDFCSDTKKVGEKICKDNKMAIEYKECPSDYSCKDGVCVTGELISEQIKCIFKNAKELQKCYTSEQNSRAYCSGIETCVVDIKGYKGEKIIWKSSCPGYAYTKMDGESEYAEFYCGKCQPTKCEDGTITECKEDNEVCTCSTCPPIIIKPVCGNGICESGEGEICACPAVASVCKEGKECIMPPCKCSVSCPEDCKQIGGINANLNEKFKLQIHQSVKINENENPIMKITFKDLIAYKCKEIQLKEQEKKEVEKKVAYATGKVVSEEMVSGAGMAVPISVSSEKVDNVLKCVGSGPKALLNVDLILSGKEKNTVINLDLGEKKQVKDFTISFIDYDYALRTGVFLVTRGIFSCKKGCKCNEKGDVIECPDKTCEEKETLCPDGVCREECKMISPEDCKYGCLSNGKCFPMGVRYNGTYCSGDLVMSPQTEDNGNCENNFECQSNVCVSSKCISKGFLRKIIDWFSKMFGGE